jgi:SpoVK/Ycf46/Vps4 family AAA+-type ATPase
LDLAVRESALQDAALCFEGVDRLLVDDSATTAVVAALRRHLPRSARPTLFLGETLWEPANWLPDGIAIRVDIPAPDPEMRLQLWQRQLATRDRHDVPTAELSDIAARFHLDGSGIRVAATAATGQARWRGDRPTAADLGAAARTVAAPPMAGQAPRRDPRDGWDDIVLTRDGLAQLREICSRARFQRQVLDEWGFARKHARHHGLTALFSGPPGTGKSMAAEIVAADLRLDVYRIDLSAVVSKYIGETEKNLERIFRAADQGDAVLLFDEADALFGKRSETRDAHDRYANVEIAYLLQRLESYAGMALLTTNLRGNVDDAFIRRLDFVVEFPLPEEAERLSIWTRSLPPEAPMAEDIDLPFLARKFRLAGGHIHNITLAAAYLAAMDHERLAMKHLVRATRREHQKLLKMVAATDFEPYHALITDD